MVHCILGISKLDKTLVYTACTSKITTSFKAYNLAVFGQNLMKIAQGGPLILMDFRNRQKFGLYRMYQQNEHLFEGVYLAHI